MIDSPFLPRDRAYWPLVAVAGAMTVGIGVLGVGFGLLSSIISGGQVSAEQRPDRQPIVPWPIFVTPPQVTVIAAAIAVIVVIVIAARITMRLRGTLGTLFGWSLAGAAGSLMLALSFPDASIGSRTVMAGFSDHALSIVGFCIAALAALIGQGRLSRANRAVRRARLNPAFLPISPPQGTTRVTDMSIDVPPLWRWTTIDGVPTLIPEEGDPDPMHVVVLDAATAMSPGRDATATVVEGVTALREVVTDGPESAVMRYHFASPDDRGDRVIEVRVTDVSDPIERAAYRECADLIAGSFRWR